MKTTTSYTKIICIYASFVLCSAAAQSTNSTVRDCQDLQNTTITCTGCLNNTLGLKCKYLLQEGTTGSCKNLDAPLETNATSVTSIGDCGDPFLGTDANGTVVANNTPKLTSGSESTATPSTQPLTNDTTTIPPATTVPTDAPVTDPTTTTTPATTTTAVTTPSTTTTTATTTSGPTTTETTTTLIPTTNATTTETTTAPTTPATSTTPSGNVTTEAPTTPTTVNPSPAPASRGFDSASFFGGIVLVLGLLGIGYFGVRVYRQRVDRSYHTL